MNVHEDFWSAQRKEQFLVVGFSELTGLAMARLLERMGVSFKISDLAPLDQLTPRLKELNLRREDIFVGPQESTQLQGITQILLSPGVPRSISLIRDACSRGIPVWNDFDFLYPLYADKSIAAITGTDGKTTTASLLAHQLKPSRSVTLAGNIGVPIASVYDELLRCDAVVLELSSFMLEDIKRFRANVSTVLNIAEDHIDRYSSMAEYTLAKRNIVRFARSGDVFVRNLDDERIASWNLSGIEVHTVSSHHDNADAYLLDGAIDVFGSRLPVASMKIQGAHLIEDVLVATMMATAVGLSATEALALAATFGGVPHRFETIGRFSGVDVIDDSKATTVQAVHRALESLGDRNVVLILGGQDKHLDPAVLVAHERHLRAVVGYGQAGERLVSVFSRVPTHYALAFEDAVELACATAENNDVLLLSPASTSFDQHRDYRQRGQIFRSLVRQHLFAP